MGILTQLLLSNEMTRQDIPYVLPCFYWIKGQVKGPYRRLSPSLRMQCNERQRKIYHAFPWLSATTDDAALARSLTSDDDYSDSLRLCAFLELLVENKGPYGVLGALHRIRNGRKRLRYAKTIFKDLMKSSEDSIFDLLATIVHTLGQSLAETGCKAQWLQEVADGVSAVLRLSGEHEMARVFQGTRPKLEGGELTLCYALLLNTGPLDEDDTAALWSLFCSALWEDAASAGTGTLTSIAIIAITVLIYLAGEGSEVLFPSLYAELSRQSLLTTARSAWGSLDGHADTWNELERNYCEKRNIVKRLWRNKAQSLDASSCDGSESSETECAGSNSE